jgi:cytochrome c-type biogenesis protein CcmH
MRRLAIAASMAAAIALGTPALAVQPDEKLSNPQLESRAREISAELRCLVCQNQSIDDSDAPLARDLRLLVRERLQAGDSNDKVLQFLVDRYGEFILLRPPFSLRTYALWGAPLLILLMGIVLVRRTVMASRGRDIPSPPDLTAQEQQRLRELLDSNPAQHKAEG